MYSSVLTVLSSLSNSCTSIILIKAISITTVTREMCPAEKIIMFIPSLAPYQMFPPPTLHNQTKSPVPSQYPWRHYSHHLSLSPRSIIIISNVTPGHSPPVSVILCHDWSQHNQLQIAVRGPVRGSETQLRVHRFPKPQQPTYD